MFQFPANPLMGQIFDAAPGVQYKWNGTGWMPFSTVFLGGLTFTGPVLFADGTLGAPGLAWALEPVSGFRRVSTGNFAATVNGAHVLQWSATTFSFHGFSFSPTTGGLGFYDFRQIPNNAFLRIGGANSGTQPGIELTSFSPSGGLLARINMLAGSYTPGAESAEIGFSVARNAPAGMNDFVMTRNNTNLQPLFLINSGFDGGLANATSAGIIVQSAGTLSSGICLLNTGQAPWLIMANRGAANLYFGDTGATGPAGIAGFAMIVQRSGTVLARSFNPVSLFAADTDGDPITTPLASVLSLVGRRSAEGTGVSLSSIQAAFPDLVSDTGLGFGINYNGLVAPIIEAIREINDRMEDAGI